MVEASTFVTSGACASITKQHAKRVRRICTDIYIAELEEIVGKKTIKSLERDEYLRLGDKLGCSIAWIFICKLNRMIFVQSLYKILFYVSDEYCYGNFCDTYSDKSSDSVMKQTHYSGELTTLYAEMIWQRWRDFIHH